MEVARFRSIEEFQRFEADNEDKKQLQLVAEGALFTSEAPFRIEAFCHVCGKPSNFHVDFAFTSHIQGHTYPAWRESVVCFQCHLSNRLRASVHLLDLESRLQRGDPLYLTEQVSNLFRVLSNRHKKVQGSEYLGSDFERGKKDEKGIRNEDIMHLTFPDASFAAVMCFEVLEHVPDHLVGLAEIFRVLRPGGRLILSVPFTPDKQESTERARVRPDGEIEHLLEPEYHVDPLSSKGCLCFRHFGWQVLDELKAVGFKDAYVVRYSSSPYGYLGLDPFQFIAIKGEA